ncbi:MAG: hypothetical protein OJF49_002286 [Ktedonobacterales bacterium]|nr:MAG: hypothetical protein OJF49_002286 [Ktedonobacterales bacterium]
MLQMARGRIQVGRASVAGVRQMPLHMPIDDGSRGAFWHPASNVASGEIVR